MNNREVDRGFMDGDRANLRVYREANVLSAQVLRELDDWVSGERGEPGGVWVSKGQRTVSHAFRRAEIRFLRAGEPLADRLLAILLGVATRAVRYLADPGVEGKLLTADVLQHSIYGPDGGHYAWHTDTGKRPDLPLHVKQRRLTMCVSVRASTHGGLLELEGIGPIEPAIGGVVAFQSSLRHRVTPVMDGERHSLTTWYSARDGNPQE
ncbi:MAG: 2OG-Fe(II) oxygenase [Acidobacteria bacterium]|nr:2OG-Fe(II) oxygenase [Acidobacteriota bacterium]